MNRGSILVKSLVAIVLLLIVTPVLYYQLILAQALASTSRTRADLRSMLTGVKSYRIDNNSYPPWVCGGAGCSPESNWRTHPFMASANGFADPHSAAANLHTHRIWTQPRDGDHLPADEMFMMLTTPVTHINALFSDPWSDVRGATYGYYATRNGYILYSPGPSGTIDNFLPGRIDPYVEQKALFNGNKKHPGSLLLTGAGDHSSLQGNHHRLAFTYDPSNGVFSPGDIYITHGGDAPQTALRP